MKKNAYEIVQTQYTFSSLSLTHTNSQRIHLRVFLQHLIQGIFFFFSLSESKDREKDIRKYSSQLVIITFARFTSSVREDSPLRFVKHIYEQDKTEGKEDEILITVW